MVLRFVEGFDQYGLDKNKMLQGNWAQIDSGFSLSTTARTGSNSFLFNSQASQRICRRVLPVPFSSGGIGFAFRVDQLPNNDRLKIMELRNISNGNISSLSLGPTGSITASGTGHNVTSLSNHIIAGNWHFIEYKFIVDQLIGGFELRVEGVPVTWDGPNSALNTGTNQVAQFVIGKTSASVILNVVARWDDMFQWDSTGTINNDFMGDSRAVLIKPNGDTASADWTVTGAASGFEAINEVPDDGDTSYIQADTTGNTSEFTLEDANPNFGTIHGVQVTSTMKKLDSGFANVQHSMVSGASVATGADRPITQTYAQWSDVFETDPATGQKWTSGAFNASTFRIEKTS